jgi:hypothetical protein
MTGEQSSRGQTQRKSALSFPLTAGAQTRPRSQPSPFQGSSWDHAVGPLLLDNLPVFTQTHHRQNAVLFLQEHQILFPTPAVQHTHVNAPAPACGAGIPASSSPQRGRETEHVLAGRGHPRNAAEEHGRIVRNLIKIKAPAPVFLHVRLLVRGERPDGPRPHLVEASLRLHKSAITAVTLEYIRAPVLHDGRACSGRTPCAAAVEAGGAAPCATQARRISTRLLFDALAHCRLRGIAQLDDPCLKHVQRRLCPAFSAVRAAFHCKRLPHEWGKRETDLYGRLSVVSITLLRTLRAEKSSDFRTHGMAAPYMQPLRVGRETSGTAPYGEPTACMSMCLRICGPED